MQKYLIVAVDTANILHLLRDPIWQSVGVILAVIIGFVSIILTLNQRKHKQLSFSVLPQIPLVRGDKDLMGLLEITFKGKPVRRLHAVYVEIYNSGNTAILPGDYEEPIAINFTKDAQLLNADIVSSTPKNLKIAANVQHDKVMIAPTLLNAGDTFIVRILVDKTELSDGLLEKSNVSVPLSVSGRIVDVRQICAVPQSTSRSVSNVFGTIKVPRVFSQKKNRPAITNADIESGVLPVQQKQSYEKELQPPKLEDVVVQEVVSIDVGKEAVSDVATCPIPIWEELPNDQKMPYYTSAVQWLKDEGVAAPRPLATENVAKGLWHKEHQVKSGIQAEFMATKVRKKRIDMSEDVKRALRRLPEADTKD